jgi:small-conductance mechanosensitive channel
MQADIKDILVEFKEAGASSLDYQIYIVMNGRAANAYFRAQRMVQQACVETCNREGWVIPFTQITIHSASSAEDPAKQPGETAGGATQIAAAALQNPG